MRNFNVCSYIFVLLVIMVSSSQQIDAQTCKPSGRIRGRKSHSAQCNIENDVCCIEGRFYITYTCSPPVSSKTKATLTLISFEKGGDDSGPSKCDNQYHSDETPVVALSTGWYKGGDRCHNFITINGNGKRVKAMVVDECDSTMGCDDDHGYQPPCPNNIVDASQAVWKALNVSLSNWGDLDITWSDA
uniref:putative ripening-related protein 1 n=1 Tax=Erigeron canadensis TaxID=72917 RepID=UPI001CB8DAFF|nr:putative ripening-related protein 1 [Erigeron canadensis]